MYNVNNKDDHDDGDSEHANTNKSTEQKNIEQHHTRKKKPR